MAPFLVVSMIIDSSLKEHNLKEQIPYPTAKPMLLIDSEDPDEIKEIVIKAVTDLKK